MLSRTNIVNRSTWSWATAFGGLGWGPWLLVTVLTSPSPRLQRPPSSDPSLHRSAETTNSADRSLRSRFTTLEQCKSGLCAGTKTWPMDSDEAAGGRGEDVDVPLRGTASLAHNLPTTTLDSCYAPAHSLLGNRGLRPDLGCPHSPQALRRRFARTRSQGRVEVRPNINQPIENCGVCGRSPPLAARHEFA